MFKFNKTPKVTNQIQILTAVKRNTTAFFKGHADKILFVKSKNEDKELNYGSNPKCLFVSKGPEQQSDESQNQLCGQAALKP